MLKYHNDLIQGSDEWLAARCGLITASEMKLIMTPTLKAANNDKSRAHLWELTAQRITGYVEPSFISDDMLRGMEDEAVARDLYARGHAPVTEVGFITNDEWGFTLGYSPDGLVGDDGLIEIKSRRQKYQIETIINGEVPQEYMLQIQTGLMITGRKWLDFISYSGGLPMVVIRVYNDATMQEAILSTAREYELRIAEMMGRYDVASAGMIKTERRVDQEMYA